MDHGTSQNSSISPDLNLLHLAVRLEIYAQYTQQPYSHAHSQSQPTCLLLPTMPWPKTTMILPTSPLNTRLSSNVERMSSTCTTHSPTLPWHDGINILSSRFVSANPMQPFGISFNISLRHMATAQPKTAMSTKNALQPTGNQAKDLRHSSTASTAACNAHSLCSLPSATMTP